MKMKSLLAASVGGVLLSACSKEPTVGASGAEPDAVKQDVGLGVVTVDDGGNRPLYSAMQKHLRLGGDYYSYTYVGDSYAEIGELVDEWVVTPFLAEELEKEGVDFSATGLLSWSGLDQIEAMGASSHAIDGGHESRTVFVLDDPKAGVWQLMGEPRPALSANVFASDVSFAMDMQIDLRGTAKWLDGLKPMIGEEASIQLDMAMNEGAGDKTVAEMLDTMNARIAVGLTVHSGSSVDWDLGGMIVTTPNLDAIVCIEGGTENFDELRTLISSNPQVEKVEFADGITGYAMTDALPLAMEDLRPAIAYDAENNRIFIASRVSYLEMTLASAEKLKDSSAYQAAMKGLPTDVISTIYFSKQAGEEIGGLIEGMFTDHGEMISGQLAQGAAQASNGEAEVDVEEVQQTVDKLLALREKYLSQPWVAVTSRDGNAVYTIKRTPFNARPLFLQEFLSVNPMTMGVLSTMLFSGAEAYKEGADRSVCILNQRNAQVATRAWSNLNGHEIGDPLLLDDVVGPDRFIETMPTCSDGEYTWSETIPEEGEQCMTCSNPDHAPENTDDW